MRLRQLVALSAAARSALLYRHRDFGLCLLAALCCSGFYRPAQGVIIESGNGQSAYGTVTDPLNPFTANVGLSSTGNGSVTYLGNDWAITADHVSISTSVTIDGTVYPVSSTLRLHDPANPLTPTDLELVKIKTGGVNPAPPALASIYQTIPATSPAGGTPVEMVGNGSSLVTGTQTYYNASFVEQGSPIGASYSGFDVNSSHTVRYGHNAVDAGSVMNLTPGYGYGPVHIFTTTFNDLTWTGTPKSAVDQAQAVSGDSGGAVFSIVGGHYLLSGIMLVEGTYNGQPSSQVLFGDQTGIADLSQYRSQILAVVPEPDAMVLGLLGGVLVLVAGWVRRQNSLARRMVRVPVPKIGVKSLD